MSQITLASYNLNHGSNKVKLIANINYLATQGVDVFCLQEIRTGRHESFIGDDMLSALGPSWKAEFLLSYNSKNDYGLGVIWNADKLQLQHFQSIDLPTLQGIPRLQSIIEQYLLSGDASPVKRAANVALFKVDDAVIRIVNVHADWHGGMEHRLSQVKHLLEYLKSEPYHAELICGDFNTIGLLSNKKQMTMLRDALGAEYVSAFPDFRLTTFHGQHLDHIFAKNCDFKRTQIYRIMGSDHFPVVAEVEL